MTAKKVGRPKKEVDFEELKKLCQMHCTRDEICSFLEIDDETLTKRIQEEGYEDFSTYYKKNTEGGRASLRRMQWMAAENGSIPMLIWLGKQTLGQNDKVEQNFRDVTPLPQIILVPQTKPNTELDKQSKSSSG